VFFAVVVFDQRGCGVLWGVGGRGVGWGGGGWGGGGGGTYTFVIPLP